MSVVSASVGKVKVKGGLSLNLPESVADNQSEAQVAKELSDHAKKKVDVVKNENGEYQVLEFVRD